MRNCILRQLPTHTVVSKQWRLPPCRAVHSHRQLLSSLVFPHSEDVSIDGKHLTSGQLIDMLSASATEERLMKMQQVINRRSYSVIPVVEGLYDMGNLAAVCRSADAMGFGAVHCIMRPTDKYKRSQRTAAGADKWLDTRLWDSTAECLGALKGVGYQVVVTHLSANSVTVQDVDWTRPTAFVLGNERCGVSDTALQLADQTAIIPMAGFVESFNISVAAALIMYEAQQQRIRKLGRSGDLTGQQKQQLLASFLLRGVKNSSLMVTQLLRRPPPAHQARFFREPQLDSEQYARQQQETNQQDQQQDQEQQQRLHTDRLEIAPAAASAAPCIDSTAVELFAGGGGLAESQHSKQHSETSAAASAA